jgi:eukaryotic-like serine/threonine-protein kinase
VTATATPARSEAPVRSGERLASGYEVIAHLRRGRDLDVYDVWSEERDCRCVAKAPRTDKLSVASTQRRLVREGRLLLSLAHPHIVRAYELVEDPDPVLILETLEGETLDHLVRRQQRRLPAIDIAYLGMHLCSAVQFLHRNGIVHLDLKPSNVISDFGQAKLIDLSIARAPQTIGPGIGTRRYMAPEQVTGGEIGAATDVWGLGAVLFEAATGAPPFGETGVRPLNGSGRWSVSPNVRGHRRMQADMAHAIESCLEADPADRPGVMELSRSLDRFVESRVGSDSGAGA